MSHRHLQPHRQARRPVSAEPPSSSTRAVQPAPATDPDAALSKSLLFAIQYRRSTPAGEELLAEFGITAEREAELLTPPKNEQERASRRALLGLLIDAPAMGALCRSRLGELLNEVEPEDASAISLALWRLPAWAWESPAERAMRLRCENEARLLRAAGRAAVNTLLGM